jgi:hypothetical protein
MKKKKIEIEQKDGKWVCREGLSVYEVTSITFGFNDITEQNRPLKKVEKKLNKIKEE